ncbi:MAG: hypothetical protein HYV60_15920 [Planctomycetia bacterium]|nr:hypothetical protein [Planctomycetia bacterium]
MLAASDAAVLPTIENTIEFDGVFADIEGDSLAYSATLADGSPLPAWLRLDREALRLVATPALDEVGQQIAVAIHATDSGQPARSVSDEFAILVDNPYHNEARPTDVNNDSFVTPLDALLIINDLNENRPRALPMPPESESFDPPFRDANNDLFVTPLDALLVINDLNSPNAEGESSEGDVAAFLSIGTVTTVFEPVTMFGLTSGSRDERVARSTAATSGPTESHNTIFAAFRSPSSLRAAQGVASARFDFDRTTEDLLDVISNDVARKSPAGSELI